MICYGIAWLWLQGDLPGLMTCEPVRCAGDRAADDLRHARARCQRLLERLQEVTGHLVEISSGLALGPTCDWIVVRLDLCRCEVTVEQARRWSRELLEDIDQAEEAEAADPDEIHEPDPDCRAGLRRLGSALLGYGEALGEMEEIERRNYDREKEPALRSSSEERGGR